MSGIMINAARENVKLRKRIRRRLKGREVHYVEGGAEESARPHATRAVSNVFAGGAKTVRAAVWPREATEVNCSRNRGSATARRLTSHEIWCRETEEL